MKARKVLVMLEIETDAPLRLLRSAKAWNDDIEDMLFWHPNGKQSYQVTFLQAQANVVGGKSEGEE